MAVPGVHCGCEAVWWKRNFPAFCSDRDYVIARRTWRGEVEGEYFCVSKAASHLDAPRRGGSKRVTDFSSCWRIRWADSPLHPGRRAVEVVLLHVEDMLIPKRVAAFGAKCLFGDLTTLFRGGRVAPQRGRSLLRLTIYTQKAKCQ